eukprot:7931031-Lingulodinium_polyedra.AAC.1
MSTQWIADILAYTDNQMAPGVAQSLISGASHPVLAAHLVLFEAMARDRGHRIDYGHVKAHSGNP